MKKMMMLAMAAVCALGAWTASAVDAVQLWEGGPYFATCNVGASSPEEYGYYFWWGDTVGYEWTGSQFNAVDGSSSGFSFTYTSAAGATYGKDISALNEAGYTDESGNLVAAYDAATVKLGAPWRIPTQAEWQALVDNCTREWTTVNNVSGWRVTGKDAYNGNSIFLPVAGFGLYSDLTTGRGHIWSATASSSSSSTAYCISISSSSFSVTSPARNCGVPIRPVYTPAKIGEVCYASFEDAVATAKAGDTVTLLCDTTISGTAKVNASGVTIDLGTNTLTRARCRYMRHMVGSSSGLTSDNGKVYVLNSCGGCALLRC